MRKPSTGGIPAAIAKRLRSVRYAIGDLLLVIGRAVGRPLLLVGRLLIRVPRAIAGGFASFWGTLSVFARRRLVAAVLVAVAVVAFLALVVPKLPCQFPGGDSCPPADDAEELVPADALAYLHANLDPGTDEFGAATEIGAKLPLLGGQIADRALALIPGPGRDGPDYATAIEPWFGGEAAVAVLGGVSAVPERVDLLEVSNPQRASAYAKSLAVGQISTVEYEGVEVSTDRRHVATAQVAGFLVIGTGDGVRSVIATATGADAAESLAGDPVVGEVRDQLPDHRFAEAWVSTEGVAALIGGQKGVLGTLTPLISPGATRGVAASISASDDGFEVAIRSALDPERERASPGFFAAFPSFESGLAARLQAGTLAYLGIGDPGRTVSALLAQASAQAPGIAAGFDDLLDNLRRSGGLDLQGGLLTALGDEAAFALEPPATDGATTAAQALPYLLFVADGIDEDATRKALAALQASLADAVHPGSEGHAAVLGEQQVAGVETRSVTISPAVELSSAIFDDLAAITTNPDGIAALADGDGGLDDSDLYKRATDGFPDQASLLAYLDLGGLIAIGERAGLAEDPVYATFAGELRRLDTLGLAVSDSDHVLATDVRLLLGDPPPAADSAPLAAPAE